MKSETIRISGMSCNHCVTRVANALRELDGVSEADVSLDEGGKAEVSYDESRLDRSKIAEVVTETGYTVEG